MATTIDAAPLATTNLLDSVANLAPRITARIAEIEATRRVPLDLVESLAASGCFRMLLPTTHGGQGIALPDAMRVYEALAELDASVGWTVMIGASAWCDVTGLSRTMFDALYADDPDVIIGGAFAPTGVAVPVDGGYRVQGRWGFASGCEHCGWLYGGCMEGEGGTEGMRMVVFAAGEVDIEDTWKVSGLCGTGSHHFAANDVFVPAERSFSMLEEATCLDEPLLRVPPPAMFALEIASVAIGIARGALNEMLTASHRTPFLGTGPLANNPLFQRQLAASDTELRAARALLYGDAHEAWEMAARNAPLSLEQRARIRSTAAWATSTAAAVVDAAYNSGGGSSLYLDSPLQRRLRDIHGVTQHFLVKPDTLTTAGALLAGQELDLPVF